MTINFSIKRQMRYTNQRLGAQRVGSKFIQGEVPKKGGSMMMTRPSDMRKMMMTRKRKHAEDEQHAGK